MNIEVSVCWQQTDLPVLFNNPYTENYEAIDFFGKYGASYAADGSGPLFYPKNSLTTVTPANWVSGMNSLDTTIKEVSFVINGAANSSKNLVAQAAACRELEASWCIESVVVTSECTGTPLVWTDPATWGGSVPTAGQDVEIKADQNIVFNLGESPKFGLIKVFGCLSFLNDNSKDQTLHAH